MDYIIIKEIGFLEFVKTVKEKLTLGYQLVGGVSITYIGQTQRGTDIVMHAQALVKKQ